MPLTQPSHSSLIKKYLITMLEMIFVILVGLVTVSALFPRYLPRVDTIRVRAQQMFFSSLSAVRYPDAPIRDALVQESVFAHLATHMQVGDILFSHRAGFVTNDLIDGKRKHVSVYLGYAQNVRNLIQQYHHILSGSIQIDTQQRKDTDMLIIDSTEDGVSIRTLDSLTYLDDILVVRMTKLDRTQDMILTIIQQLGKAYNYDFDIEDVHSVYCAQLISQGLGSIGIDIPYTSFAGRSYVYPQDIVDYIMNQGIGANEFTLITAIKNIQNNPIFYNSDKMKSKRNAKSIE